MGLAKLSFTFWSEIKINLLIYTDKNSINKIALFYSMKVEDGDFFNEKP